MPFQTDNAWPSGLLTIFTNACRRRGDFESRFHGPHDKLLNYCFGGNFMFYITPQDIPPDINRETLYPTICLVVFDIEHRPVFFIDVKDDSCVKNAEIRYRVDEQMRDRYAFMLEQSPIPRLWGLSVLGTSMRIYCGDTELYEVSPPSVSRPEPSTRILPSTFLAGEWDLDLLSQQGFDKMKEIVTDVLTQTGNN